MWCLRCGFVADIVCICEDDTTLPEQPNKLPHIGKVLARPEPDVNA